MHGIADRSPVARCCVGIDSRLYITPGIADGAPSKVLTTWIDPQVEVTQLTRWSRAIRVRQIHAEFVHAVDATKERRVTSEHVVCETDGWVMNDSYVRARWYIIYTIHNGYITLCDRVIEPHSLAITMSHRMIMLYQPHTNAVIGYVHTHLSPDEFRELAANAVSLETSCYCTFGGRTGTSAPIPCACQATHPAPPPMRR